MTASRSSPSPASVNLQSGVFLSHEFGPALFSFNFPLEKVFPRGLAEMFAFQLDHNLGSGCELLMVIP